MGRMGKKTKPHKENKEQELINNKQNIKDRSGEDDDQLKLKRSTIEENTDKSGACEKEGAETDIAVQLKKALEDEKLKAKENYDRLLRVSAEFENYKKRNIKEISDYRKYANEALIGELLSVVDNLERAIESSSSVSHMKDNPLVDGVGMTLKSILAIFEKFNVHSIDSVGKPFDPSFHQAMVQEETDKYPENTVLKEFQKGYLIHDRLLRPSMVIVSKRKSDGNR